MKKGIQIVAVVLLSALSAATAFAQGAPVKGQVTKIDESTGRITLKHEPIPNLDMGSMTMVFRVKDPSMVKSVKVGDNVIFEADRVNGAITIISIEKE